MTDTPIPQRPDVEDLRERYRVEREKRLRADGTDQYRASTDALGNFTHDPYVENKVNRSPRVDEVTTLIVGGGFGGLLVAARLRQADVNDFVLVDKASDFGDT